jgi:hypothetical protein
MALSDEALPEEMHFLGFADQLNKKGHVSEFFQTDFEGLFVGVEKSDDFAVFDQNVLITMGMEELVEVVDVDSIFFFEDRSHRILLLNQLYYILFLGERMK